MEVHWDNRHQPHTMLLWKIGFHGNQMGNINNLIVLSHIEFIFGMEVPWGSRNQTHTWLLWKFSSYGNQSETSITSLS